MALLNSVTLFGYFWLVGFAMLALLHRRDDRIRSVLVAPAMGIITLLYANYLMSRVGLAIEAAALPITAFLLVASIVILAWMKPPLPGRHGWPYLGVIAFAFATNGWPLLRAGFAWLGGLNPDASNYILQASRFAHEGFEPAPDPTIWLTESDWSIHYVLNSFQHIRIGTDILLAWVGSITRQDERASLMPLMVTLHIAAICAAIALIGPGDRRARLFGGFLLASAALMTEGVTLQLLGQELGLVCLSLSAVILLGPFYRTAPRVLFRTVVLAALIVATFILSYPEMLPFFGLGFLLYHGLSIGEAFRHRRAVLISGSAIAVATTLLILPDIVGLLLFVVRQAGFAQSSATVPAFPYMLIPSGVAVLWGLRQFVPNSPAPLGEDAAIWVGYGLSALAFCLALWLGLRRTPCAAILLVMLGLGVELFESGSGFGLFKLAMYVQPFLLMTFIVALFRLLQVAR